MKLQVKLFLAHAFIDVISQRPQPLAVGAFFRGFLAVYETGEESEEELLDALHVAASDLADTFLIMADRCEALLDRPELEARTKLPGELAKEAEKNLRLLALLNADPLEVLALAGRERNGKH